MPRREWASRSPEDLAAEQRVAAWAGGLIRGETPSLVPVDDATYRCLSRARLAGLAADSAAGDPRIVQEAKLAFVRETVVEEASWRAAAVLGAAGIPCVTLKGPAVASCFWKGKLRGSTDVDLLVTPDVVEQARAALLAVGASQIEAMPEWFQRGWHYHIELRYPEPPCTIELHWSLLSSRGGKLPVAQMIAAARPVRCRSHELPALDPVWSLIAACIHAVVHDLTLRELVDVGFVAATLTEREIRDAILVARACGLGTYAYFGLAVSAERLGWPLPPEFENLRPGPFVDGLVRRYAGRMPLIGSPSWPMRQVGRVVRPLFAGSPAGWLLAAGQNATRQVRLARLIERIRRRA